MLVVFVLGVFIIISIFYIIKLSAQYGLRGTIAGILECGFIGILLLLMYSFIIILKGVM